MRAVDPDDTAAAAADRMIRAIGRPVEREEVAFRNDPRGRRAHRHRLRVARQDEALRAGNFDVRDTRPIGGRVFALWYPMYCSRARPCEWDEGDGTEVLEAFGFPSPPVAWSLGAYVNAGDAHRILADVAAFMAEQTGGVIDFGDLLSVAAELPGGVRTIGGGVPGRSRTTFMDAVAMRAWSQRPDCRMIK